MIQSHQLPEAATEATKMLDLLLERSEYVLAKLREEDWDEVSTALHQRKSLMQRAKPLLENCRLDTTEAETAPVRTELLRKLLKLQQMDTEIAAKIVAQQNGVSGEIDALTHKKNQIEAYGSGLSGAGKHFDAIR